VNKVCLPVHLQSFCTGP